MATEDDRSPAASVSDDDGVEAWVHARRDRHRRRPLVVRALAVIAGALVSALGVGLLIPLPEAGVPALLGGLGLLALEYDWAAAALIRVERAWRRFKGLALAARVAIIVALAAVLIAALVLAL